MVGGEQGEDTRTVPLASSKLLKELMSELSLSIYLHFTHLKLAGAGACARGKGLVSDRYLIYKYI